MSEQLEEWNQVKVLAGAFVAFIFILTCCIAVPSFVARAYEDYAQDRWMRFCMENHEPRECSEIWKNR